ncbi:hypothetical protein BK816_06105 [Boudabousia tangfeifanii]|uniref:Zinc ABC transporter substrate-binding protein n=1 Tax=Boudabousia tangfeifanii TaxID=1912795 RepID=A0A1D9MKS6_9ACTO|nr:zinc ABC transporter substrate-binding protein [Boudabousia tangfeifanii]AOZ72917.1 hypothetical protein BK816_06105 [Boudabousia tangfeifanii]
MKKALVVTFSAAALALAGCSSNAETSTTPEANGSTAKLSVLTSLYPLEFLAKEVGGNLVDVQTLAPAGVEPHDLELSPKQVNELGQAGAIVYMKGFQSAVDEAIAQTEASRAIDISEAAELMPATGEGHHHHHHDGDDHTAEGHDHEGEDHDHTAEGHDHEGEDHDHTAEGHDHEGETAEGHDHEEAGHDHDHENLPFDPHFWLDPNRMAKVATLIGDKFAEIDPTHAADFKANAAKTAGAMKALAEEAVKNTQTCEHRTFVTTHEAFGYFAKLTNLEQAGLSGLDPESSPSPARLAEISKLVKDKGLNTIFTEELVSPKVADTLAKDLGIKAEVLSPIETQTDPSKDYVDMFKGDVSELVKALNCK